MKVLKFPVAQKTLQELLKLEKITQQAERDKQLIVDTLLDNSEYAGKNIHITKILPDGFELTLIDEEVKKD